MFLKQVHLLSIYLLVDGSIFHIHKLLLLWKVLSEFKRLYSWRVNGKCLWQLAIFDRLIDSFCTAFLKKIVNMIFNSRNALKKKRALWFNSGKYHQ